MEYFSPTNTDELTDYLATYKEKSAIIAGCTDILVKKAFFKEKEAIINLLNIDSLKHITQKGDKLLIGSSVTFTDLLESKEIKELIPPLHQAAKVYGSVQIRNRGTIGGNIVNASPAADSVPVLMAYNAKFHLQSQSGKEILPIHTFFKGPGKTALKPDQFLESIELDIDTEDYISFYRKIGTRKALSISKAAVAFRAKSNEKELSDVSIAYGSVGPTVLRSTLAAKALEGNKLTKETIQKAGQLASQEVTPIADIRSSAEYRRLVIGNVLEQELLSYL